MRRFSALVAVLLVVLASSVFAVNREKQAYLLDEVLRLSHEGVPDRLILKQIEAMDHVFELTADDIVELRTLGVSDEVIEALIDTRLREGESDGYVRVSAGYYSPWYHFPYAWGYYYDPFPDWYSYHYYPFHYSSHEFGWYGWCGNSYYYTYNGYDQPYNRDYRRHRQRDRDGGYRVTRHVSAEVASVPVRPVRETPAGAGVAPARARGRDSAAEPRTRTIATRVVRPSIQTPRAPYRADRVSTPPSRGQSGVRRWGGSLDVMRAPVSTPEAPAATRAEPVVRGTEESRPPVQQRESKPPTLHERRATTVEPRTVRESVSAPRVNVAPQRVSRPAAPPSVRSQPSAGIGRSHAVPSTPPPAAPRGHGISRGKIR